MTGSLSYFEAMDIIGGLSTPSKMPWYGWSTSAFDCKTGSKLREVKGSTCASCYACKGNYRFKNVKQAHERRLKALDHPEFINAFVLVLTVLYNREKRTYTKDGVDLKENRFRWHDSGDIQSVEHLKMICEIASRTPFLIHWIPTREVHFVHEFLKAGYTFPDNLTIRISAVMVGESFVRKPMGLPTSTVGVEDAPITCPARNQDNKCKNCSNCWDKDKDVNYPLH